MFWGQAHIYKWTPYWIRLDYTKCSKSLEELEGLYSQDKWREFSNSSREILETGKFLLRYAQTTIETLMKRKEEILEDTFSWRSKCTSHPSRRPSSKAHSQKSSSSSARREALAAAAAKEQAEFDRIIAERPENERGRQVAKEELRRKCAQAQHQRDMALLAAEKATAVADARLKAIEQCIIDERMTALLGGDEPENIRSRTQSWVDAQANIRHDRDDTRKDMAATKVRTSPGRLEAGGEDNQSGWSSNSPLGGDHHLSH